MAIVVLPAIDFDVLEPNIPLIAASVDSAMPGSFLMVECGTPGWQEP